VLRITNKKGATENTWILSGALTGPWVAEFRANWKEIRKDCPDHKCLVDLHEVISVDTEGQRLLEDLADEGAEFIASGVYLTHMLGGITSKQKDRGLARDHSGGNHSSSLIRQSTGATRSAD
jgi:hypothetical protein